MKITASIVCYGGFEDVQKCVDSLLACTQKYPLRLYIIDNLSPDDTAQRLKMAYGENSQITLLFNEKNLGYGTGHNTCLPLVDSDFHAVINPDIVVDSDVLSALADFLVENKDVAIVTPRLMFPNGKEQFVAKRKPNFMGLVARQLPFGFLKKYEDYYLMKDKDLLTPTDVQFVSGCFFMMPTKIMAEIGGFDEKYFMYVEDADITQKALLKGRAVYNPEVYVFHSWNRQARKIGKAFFMQIKSMARYFKKWGFSLGLNKHV